MLIGIMVSAYDGGHGADGAGDDAGGWWSCDGMMSVAMTVMTRMAWSCWLCNGEDGDHSVTGESHDCALRAMVVFAATVMMTVKVILW